MRILFLLVLFPLALSAPAQRFYENGMLYSDQMLEYWKPQPDSLQQAWQKEKVYCKSIFSEPYAIAHNFSLDTLVNSAYADIQNGIDWDVFKSKYPAITAKENFIVTFEKWETRNEETIHFRSMFERCNCPDIDASTDISTLQGSFVIDYYRKDTTDTPGYLSGLFIKSLEQPQLIPETYATWIHYADFITGPEPLFLNKYFSMYAMYRGKSQPRPAHDRFFEYIDIPGMPQPSELLYTNAKYIDFTGNHYSRNDLPYRIWQEKRELHIQENLTDKAEFKLLLGSAVEETIRLGIPDELLENWALQYLDEYLGWTMMRLRPVYSSCGNDPAPTERLYEIAKYCSFENNHWFGFIRAHLGLINDRTDWSIYYKTRFVRELEALDLDVPALLLGSLLQMNNTPSAHNEGNVKQVGWALAQCKIADQVAETLSLGIADEQLDMQNRLILYRVYRHMLLRRNGLKFDLKEHSLISKNTKEQILKVQNTLPQPWRDLLDDLTQW